MGTGNGHVHYRDGIAIAQVVLFSFSLIAAYYYRRTHRVGWFCSGLFSLLRVIGASWMLGTVNSDSKGLWAGVFVCEGLGVLLLIFLCLEGAQRV